TTFDTQPTDALPKAITYGPDGNVWFTDANYPAPPGGRSGAIGVATLDTHLSTVVTAGPPPQVSPGDLFGLSVQIRDGSGALDTNFNGPVTVTFSNNPGGGTPSGTLVVPAHNGVATFSGLALNNLGNGYTLLVSASGPATTTTTPINVSNS